MLQRTGNGKSSKRRKKDKRIAINAWFFLFIIAVILLFLIGRPLIKNHVTEYSVGDVIPKEAVGDLYIDISHHNNVGEIKWDSLMVMTDAKRRTVQDISVAKDIRPLAGVIIKATEGAGMKDKMFKKYWKDSSKKGLVRGAYHFFRSSKDGKEQAKTYIRTVGNIPHNDLAPIIDIETIHKGCTKELLNKRVREWIQTVEKHYGRKPIIYTYDSFAKDYLDKDILEDYPVWIAHYKTERPVLQKWMMWQFSESALVYGFPGKVDLSVMRWDNN